MEIFHAEDGGRYMYANDIERLQDVALELEQLFSGCDDCVISGCAVTSSSGTLSISAGLVYLDGKIRKVSQYSCSGNRAYLEVSNGTIQVAYADGATKDGTYVYSTSWKIIRTGARYLEFTSSNTVKRLDKGLFGKYALLLNGGNQSVSGAISFPGQIQPATIVFPNSTNQIYADNSDSLVIESTRATGKAKISMGTSYVGLWTNELESFTVQPELVHCTPAFQADLGLTAKDYAINDDGIYLAGTSDIGTFWLNKKGQNDGTAVFRPFSIGDGKGNTIFEILPSNTTTYKLFSPVRNTDNPIISITDEVSGPVTLVRGQSKFDQALIKVVSETPSNDSTNSASNTTTITYEPVETYFAKVSDLNNYVLTSYLTANYTTTTGVDTKIATFQNTIATNNLNASGTLEGKSYQITGTCYKWGKLRVLIGVLSTGVSSTATGVTYAFSDMAPSGSLPINAHVIGQTSITETGFNTIGCHLQFSNSSGYCTFTWNTSETIPSGGNLVTTFNIVYFVE